MGRPVSIAAVFLSQLLQPLGFDVGRVTGENPGGEADFRGDYPGAAAVEKPGSGIQHHLAAFGCRVHVFFFFLRNVGKITAEDTAVNPVGNCLVNFDLHRFSAFTRDISSADDFQDLVINITPFRHPPVGKKMIAAEFAQPVLRLHFFDRIGIAVPYLQVGEKIGFRVLELRVRHRRLVNLVIGTLAWVLNAQGCRHNSNLVDAAFFLRFDNHSRYSRIEWKQSHGTADRSQCVVMGLCFAFVAGERSQVSESFNAVADVFRMGPVNERKGSDIPQIQ